MRRSSSRIVCSRGSTGAGKAGVSMMITEEEKKKEGQQQD